ncbi:hypothetical protein WA158_006312 [Blastocystis sp. Blastoise]
MEEFSQKVTEQVSDAVEEPKDKQRRPGPRPVPCPWCDQTKCNHCRCLGHANCSHKPGEMCTNERYKRRLVCNPCEKNKLRKQKENVPLDNTMSQQMFPPPPDYRLYMPPVDVGYNYAGQQIYRPVPLPYNPYPMKEDAKMNYVEYPMVGGMKRSVSKNSMMSQPNMPADESILISYNDSDTSIGVVTLNPETKFLTYVRKYLYKHFLDDIHHKEFSFVTSNGESIPQKKEVSTLCSQVIQLREKKHHTFNSNQSQKVLFIKKEEAMISQESIESANDLMATPSLAEKRVKMDIGDIPTTAVPTTAVPTTSTPTPTPTPTAAVPAPPAPTMTRTPSYPYMSRSPTPYYSNTMYYVSQIPRYNTVNPYNPTGIPQVMSYGSIPSTMGSFNSMNNFYPYKRDTSYNSLDGYDTSYYMERERIPQTIPATNTPAHPMTKAYPPAASSVPPTNGMSTHMSNPNGSSSLPSSYSNPNISSNIHTHTPIPKTNNNPGYLPDSEINALETSGTIDKSV